MEGRDINWGAPTEIKGHRMTTGSGGEFHEWQRAGRMRPYGKFLIGFGGVASSAMRPTTTVTREPRMCAPGSSFQSGANTSINSGPICSAVL